MDVARTRRWRLELRWRFGQELAPDIRYEPSDDGERARSGETTGQPPAAYPRRGGCPYDAPGDYWRHVCAVRQRLGVASSTRRCWVGATRAVASIREQDGSYGRPAR
jgi:hypothetical protein